MRKKLIRSTAMFTLLSLFLLLAGCASSDTLIIDGEVAREIENRINVLAYDEFQYLRGNTPGNIRNGGEILIAGDQLEIVQRMEFGDDSVLSYLQSIPLQYLDSYSTQYDYISEMNGPMVTKIGSDIYYLDTYPSRLNLDTFISEQLCGCEATAFEFFDGIGYFSDIDGNIYSVTAEETPVVSQLLFEAGRLLNIDSNHIYTIVGADENEEMAVYDRNSLLEISRIGGGPFIDAQISGQYLYYRNGFELRRISLIDPNERERASMIDVKEYAILSHTLVIADVKGGLYASHLDGTGIMKLSADKASSLHMMDDMVFYRNGYDMDRWYAIRLSTDRRFAVIGETMTDGGIQFFPLSTDTDTRANSFFGGYVSSLEVSSNPLGLTPIVEGTHPLFIDLMNEERPRFYTYHNQYTNPENIDLIITITKKETVIGRYTDDYLAYRTDSILSLYTLTSPRPILTLIQQGLPPIEVKHGKGDRYGVPASWHTKALEIMDLIENQNS